MLGSLFSHFAASCTQSFIGLLPWDAYLPQSDFGEKCSIVHFNLLGANSDIILIILAVLDDLIRIAALVAVIFVIYAGIKYITSQGDPGQTAQALSTVINALVGLVIAIVAVGLVSFIGYALGGGYAPGGGGGLLDLSVLPNPAGTTDGSVVKTILTIVFGIVGALSFLFIVIGGLRYITAHGEPQSVARAKNTVLYSLIGLAVAIVAESIVSFVVGKL